MDRLEAMSMVLAVAETGSLSAAARRLKTPVATASRKITELEAHLRVKLFDRSTGKLVLTDAGASYAAALNRILADLSEAQRVAGGEYTVPTGELIVTAPASLARICLVPILAEFLSAYPDISVRLALGDRIVNLSEDHVDVALRLGVLPDSRLMALRVGRVQVVVCASPSYLASRGTPQTPSDVVDHDCIVYDSGHVQDRWSFVQGRDRYCDQGASPARRAECRSGVRRGAGRNWSHACVLVPDRDVGRGRNALHSARRVPACRPTSQPRLCGRAVLANEAARIS
jgi:DNA-binding transcriptional LysR family regulator